MKLWEILKVENTRKKYNDNRGGVYELRIDRDGTPVLVQANRIVGFSQYQMLNLDFEEVKAFNGWERLSDGNEYYYVDYDSTVENDIEYGDMFENLLYEKCNYFSTREKAEEVRQTYELYRRMLKFRDENDGEVNWDDNKSKFYIAYDHSFNKYEILETPSYERFGMVHFNDIGLAKRCIEEVIKPFFAK